MIKRYTLVKVNNDIFDLLEKISNNSLKSLETGIIYNTANDLKEYITSNLNFEIIISSDSMIEISERMKQYDTKGIQYSFTKYIR